MKPLRSLREKLFFWYATSLITVTAFFYLAVHFYSLPYGNLIFFILLLILAIEGFFIIRKMTSGITELSSKIKTITSKNLDEKITNIGSDDEIGELAGSFNQLLDRLNEAFKRERQFIGDVAHELKTPLSIQRSGLEVTISKGRTNEEYKTAISEAIEDNNRISETLNNILDLAWSEADGGKRLAGIFNLSNMLEELRDVASKMAMQKQITIKGEIEANVYVAGKQEKLGRAILNIIDNAIKFTPKKGMLFISLKSNSDNAIIKIKDTGEGIAERHIPHIFERFYQGSDSSKTRGSGLGLPISQSIIHAHQGTIKVSSVTNKGTTFTVTLPVVKNPPNPPNPLQ